MGRVFFEVRTTDMVNKSPSNLCILVWSIISKAPSKLSILVWSIISKALERLTRLTACQQGCLCVMSSCICNDTHWPLEGHSGSDWTILISDRWGRSYISEGCECVSVYLPVTVCVSVIPFYSGSLCVCVCVCVFAWMTVGDILSQCQLPLHLRHAFESVCAVHF